MTFRCKWYDLRESGCLILGAPTDTLRTHQAAGRALGRALYEQHADIDGIWYQSRLTGETVCDLRPGT